MNRTAATKVTLRRHDIARMAATEPEPVPWVVEGLVAKGFLTILAGQPGRGKSLLSEVLAAGVARGRSEAGFACHGGSVLIVDAENGRHEIHRRVRSLGMPAGGVDLYEANGFDLRRDLGELAAVLAHHCPDFLILDSFRSLWGGEENDSGEVAGALDPLRNLARETEAGVLLLHHTGKGRTDYRGSSAIAASAELGFTLAQADDDPDPNRRFVDCWKSRPAPQPPRRWLTLLPDGDRVLVAETEPHHGRGRPDVATHDVAKRLLPLIASQPLTQAEIAQSLGRSKGDGTVRRALAKLKNAGEVERDPDGLWVATKPLPTPSPASPATPKGGDGATAISTVRKLHD